MNDYKDLVFQDGVLMAGRLGPGWRVAEHKSSALFVENPQAIEVMHWFFQAATMMFQAMVVTRDRMKIGGRFDSFDKLGHLLGEVGKK